MTQASCARGLVLLVACWSLSVTTAAQNLVINPGFEDYTTCPTFLGQVDGYVDNWRRTGFGSTDYLNTCDFSRRDPRTGEGYIGMIPLDSEVAPTYREYISGELAQPLEPNCEYRVELWLILADGRTDALADFSVAFTEMPLSFSDADPHPEITPQVTNRTGILRDKVEWMHFNETFFALGGERYLTLGNFLTFEDTTQEDLGCCGQGGTYYFIDDVSVTKTNVVDPTCLHRVDFTSVAPPVPARDVVFITPRTTDDLAIEADPATCPFESGDTDPDPDALIDGVPLALYQVDLEIDTLRLEKSGNTVRFTF
ncbi:MAG: hypothetical protein AAF533_05685 [Acidobacteriota bacterium]